MRPRGNVATVLSAGSKRCSGLDDAVGRPARRPGRAATKFLNKQIDRLNAIHRAEITASRGSPLENRLTESLSLVRLSFDVSLKIVVFR